METQPASINDIMSTTFGGMALGETTYRLSSLVLNGQARGWERASHELVAAFLNPVRAVNRLMTGEAWRIGPRYVDKEATIPFHFRFEAGYRMLDNIREGKNRSIHVGCMDFSLIYNDPFEIEGNVPFEHFTARMLFNMFAHQPIIGDVNICASIWGREHDYKMGMNCLPVYSRIIAITIAEEWIMSRTKCRFAFPRLYPMAPVFYIA